MALQNERNEAQESLSRLKLRYEQLRDERQNLQELLNTRQLSDSE